MTTQGVDDAALEARSKARASRLSHAAARQGAEFGETVRPS